jgi:hypothetical protein
MMRLLALLLAVLACSKTDSSAELDGLRRQLDAVRNQVSALDTLHGARLNGLETKLTDIEFNERLDRPTRATFSADSTAYRMLILPQGAFMVSMDKVTPYADGQKVTFRIGNLQSASYANPTLKLQWGKRFDAKSMEFSKWLQSLRSKEEHVLQTLYPGAWNTVVVTLGPSTPEEVGYVELAMEVSTVNMRVQ